MVNILGVYNPIFYAQEALIQLEKALGLASRVYMGFDEERRSFRKGETINIRRPSTFDAADAPATAVDLETETVALSLNQWREVKFKLSDKELAFTGERIIQDHIRPAAYALADDIDQKLAALYADVPWYYDLNATTEVQDVIGVRQVMFDNAVPLQEMDNMHYMVSGAFEASLLGLTAFSQQQGAGDVGVNTQLRGSLGTKYGLEVFANQNTPSHVAGTADDPALLVNAAVAKGDEVITSIDAADATVAGTIVAGDVFVMQGSTQQYAVTGGPYTAAGNAFTNVTFTPPAVQAQVDGDTLTLEQDDHTANLAFHRNAFALVTAPLSEMGNELGANIATVSDPITGLSLRSRLYYVGDSSEVHVALDVLYGVKTLDPNLAVRGRGV